MNHILYFVYFATGEGLTREFRFTNSYDFTDEQAIAEFEASHDPYFYPGMQMIPVDMAAEDECFMMLLKTQVPMLHSYLSGRRDYLINIDYKCHVNMS